VWCFPNRLKASYQIKEIPFGNEGFFFEMTQQKVAKNKESLHAPACSEKQCLPIVMQAEPAG
jgi:hypothetical protein